MKLVLCEADDLGALWVYESLRARDGSAVELVTAGALAYGLSWEYRLGTSTDALRIQLSEGREIHGDQVTGVLNRLHTLPSDHMKEPAEDDLDYCVQEVYSFGMAWLSSIPAPVVNPPSAAGLSGGCRHRSEWLWQAAKAGLEIPEYRHHSGAGGHGPGEDLVLDDPRLEAMPVVIVLGNRVFMEAPDSVQDGCRRLAAASGVPLLGASFVRDAANRWLFVNATVLPDLRFAGDGFARALVEYWEATEEHSS